MKQGLAILILLVSNTLFAQDTTIRVLGMYPNHLNPGAYAMTTQLQAIEQAWTNSGLPGLTGVTIELLNGATAVPVYYPTLSPNVEQASQEALSHHEVVAMRAAWQADVVILFTNHSPCGAAQAGWHENRPFTPNAQGLDLTARHTAYLGVVNPNCDPYFVGAHEFGHIGGAGHMTRRLMYPDSRAFLYLWEEPEIALRWYIVTALFDRPTDCLTECPDPSIEVMPFIQYSRVGSQFGDSNHNNVRALATTARSLANFFPYPSTPPVLEPPVNLSAVYRGCHAGEGSDTRYDLYWVDDPDTTAAVTHYEIWKSQPIGNPFVFGWIAYSEFSEAYVFGAAGRVRVKACSGNVCSNLSDSYADLGSTC